MSEWSACDGCLRRSALLGLLTPYIARSLDERRSVPSLLALSDHDLIAAVCGRNRTAAEGLLERFDGSRAREAAAAARLAAVCRHDARFPPLLAAPPDAPALLYARGDVGLLATLADDAAVAIVGSRRGSSYGLEAAHALARELGACGVPVVSGLALGIDSAAHEGALEAGGPTVAVLAGGADVPYPRTKLHLYRRIAESGLVVSELPPGQRPERWCFPARNRIMAALATMTVVVEGAADSGSLITARFAADLGRDVGAVPGQVTSPLAQGPNDLLADGACVVRCAADVLDALYGAGEHAARRTAAASPPELEPELAELLAAVEQGAGTVDAIAQKGAHAARVLAGLTELELMGLVRRSGGGAYVRRA